MSKLIYLSLFLCIMLSTVVSGQPTHRDSVMKAARADARSFRLDNATWKKYRHRLPATSDYFKPNEVNVRNNALLTDSTYVEAYRKTAFKRNKHRRTPWHYVWLGGTIVIGTAIAGLIAIAYAVGPNIG